MRLMFLVMVSILLIGSTVSAQIGFNDPSIPKIVSSSGEVRTSAVNYSTVSVNDSTYLQGQTPAQVSGAWWNYPAGGNVDMNGKNFTGLDSMSFANKTSISTETGKQFWYFIDDALWAESVAVALAIKELGGIGTNILGVYNIYVASGGSIRSSNGKGFLFNQTAVYLQGGRLDGSNGEASNFATVTAVDLLATNDVCIDGGNCLSSAGGGSDGTGGWTNTSLETNTSLRVNVNSNISAQHFVGDGRYLTNLPKPSDMVNVTQLSMAPYNLPGNISFSSVPNSDNMTIYFYNLDGTLSTNQKRTARVWFSTTQDFSGVNPIALDFDVVGRDSSLFWFNSMITPYEGTIVTNSTGAVKLEWFGYGAGLTEVYVLVQYGENWWVSPTWYVNDI